VHVVVH